MKKYRNPRATEGESICNCRHFGIDNKIIFQFSAILFEKHWFDPNWNSPLCTYLVRDKLYDEISAIIPSFVNMTDESKFKFMYTYSEYDVIRVIVKGINDIYNARNELLNNK